MSVFPAVHIKQTIWRLMVLRKCMKHNFAQMQIINFTLHFYKADRLSYSRILLKYGHISN